MTTRFTPVQEAMGPWPHKKVAAVCLTHTRQTHANQQAEGMALSLPQPVGMPSWDWWWIEEAF
jgi:hypothetical protein